MTGQHAKSTIFLSTQRKKLLEQVSDAIRAKHYSYRTEKTYLDWIRRFIIFHNKKHPREMGVPEVTEFIIHLATKGNVSASTHALQRGRLAVKSPLDA